MSIEDCHKKLKLLAQNSCIKTEEYEAIIKAWIRSNLEDISNE